MHTICAVRIRVGQIVDCRGHSFLWVSAADYILAGHNRAQTDVAPGCQKAFSSGG
jgi:hypothetical protein